MRIWLWRAFAVFCGDVIVCVALFRSYAAVEASNLCQAENGGGVCPENNACCATRYPGISSCITEVASPHNGTSVCCIDDGVGETGCGPGYECASTLLTGTVKYYCRLVDEQAGVHHPVLPRHLPRYRLCSLPRCILDQVHALSIDPSRPYLPKLAYYSTMGTVDITPPVKSDTKEQIRVAVVVIHGSGRNADDYLCCMVSALQRGLSLDARLSTTAVLAPRFLAPRDGIVNVSDSSVSLLRWNESDPIPHTWRYGADALNANLSSYDALDALIMRLIDRLPSLERIVVAGHSAGGQLTQRWALTSSIDSWDSSSVSIHVVVANPRSFCYLDNRRFANGTLQVPSERSIHACPSYNQWEWGLDPGGYLLTPYKDRSLIKAGGASKMASRYVGRNVSYLAGALDVLPVRAGCEDDDFQGKTRRERSRLFFLALSKTFKHEHRHIVLRHIPHDHCLLFQDDGFWNVVFGGLSNRQRGPQEGLVD